MRTLIAIAACMLTLAGAAESKDMKACAADWTAQKKAGTTEAQTYKQFSATCMATGKPGVAPAPVAMPAGHPAIYSTSGVKSAGVTPSMSAASTPTGATARCKDGAFSMSRHQSGTCSHHGGVA